MLYAILLDTLPTDGETAVTTVNLLFKISWIGKQYVAKHYVTICSYLLLLRFLLQR